MEKQKRRSERDAHWGYTRVTPQDRVCVLAKESQIRFVWRDIVQKKSGTKQATFNTDLKKKRRIWKNPKAEQKDQVTRCEMYNNNSRQSLRATNYSSPLSKFKPGLSFQLTFYSLKTFYSLIKKRKTQRCRPAVNSAQGEYSAKAPEKDLPWKLFH